MIDISTQTVNVNCPECNGSITISLKQVADEVIVKCKCGQEIQLSDSDGTNQKAIHDVNKSLKNLENTFINFGR